MSASVGLDAANAGSKITVGIPLTFRAVAPLPDLRHSTLDQSRSALFSPDLDKVFSMAVYVWALAKLKEEFIDKNIVPPTYVLFEEY